MTTASAPLLDVRYLDTPRLDVGNGVELYYEQLGDSGPHVVFLNNFYIIAPMWRTWSAALPERNHLVRYDLRNQGASTSGLSEVRWTDHVNDVIAILDGVGIDSAYLVGTSASALLARDVAIAAPDRVRGVVLQGPAFSPITGRRRRAITRSWMNTLEHAGVAPLWDQLYSMVLSDQAMESGGTPLYLGLREVFTSIHDVASLLSNLASSLEPSDDPLLLSELPCPSLLIAGDADFLWSETNVAAAERLLPDNETLFLPGVGHLPFLEASEVVESATQAFIDRVERDR